MNHQSESFNRVDLSPNGAGECGEEQNLQLASSPEEVDRLNAEFYGKFPYPWRAMRLEHPLNPDFKRIMLCQELGDWHHQVIPAGAKIWVAGCGVNQAPITALSFADATVIGSDISKTSLDLSAQTARELSIDNLQLRNESLNAVSYREQFDYILCTGVIHHNADPSKPLLRLAHALKPTGILELMVYNRYHRILPAAAQKAIRALAGSTGKPGDETELKITAALLKCLPATTVMGGFLSNHRDAPIAQVADTLMQPVEHSYTVESLSELINNCELELQLPCVNLFDKIHDTFLWNLNISDPDLHDRYFRMEDSQRWQVTNLLLCVNSPMLWFYVRRKGDHTRVSERDVCETFLDTRFVRMETRQQGYTLDDTDCYRADSVPLKYPPPPPEQFKALIAMADGHTAMRDLLERHGFSRNFSEVNRIRLQLTTPAFPYLRSVS